MRDYEFAVANVPSIGFQLGSATNDAAAPIRSMNPSADLVVDGLAPGQSRIDFSAMADGDRIDDAFTIDVQAMSIVRTSPVFSMRCQLRNCPVVPDLSTTPAPPPSTQGSALNCDLPINA